MATTLLVSTSKAIFSGRMIGASPSQAEPLFIAWGTGAGTTAYADTTLFTEVNTSGGSAVGLRTTGSSLQSTTSALNDTYNVSGTTTNTSTGTLQITNAGLFTTTSVATGTLFLKTDYTSVGLAQNDSINHLFKVKFD